MDPLDILISAAAIAIPAIVFIITLTNRITKIETKLDWALAWLVCIEDHKNHDTPSIRYRKDVLRHKIEEDLNGNCKEICEEHDPNSK